MSSERRHGRSGTTASWATLAIALLAGLLLADVAMAQAPSKVDLEITVAHLTDAEGPIDPRGKKIHQKLVREFRYGGLSVVESRRMTLKVDEVGKLKLPNGRMVRLRPLVIDDRGLLMAVDVEGVLQTDLRLKSGHLVLFGAHRHGEGRLVLAVQPRL